jgi:hypothetical protein
LYLRDVTRLQIAVIALAAAVLIGAAGASAFNPDSGAVLHSLALWRIFGIMFELGLPLLVLAVIVAAIHAVVGSWRSRNIP